MAFLPPPAELERIELRHLEQVREICRTGGFSAAARKLGLSQPALSKGIARLEDRLGVPLFDRTTFAVRPTAFGQLVARHAQTLLDASDALSRELAQQAGGSEGRLRIGVGPTTRLKPLPQVVRGVLERFPTLQLETHLGDGRDIMRGVSEGRYDVVFGYSENAEAYDDLIRIKIFEDETIVVARPGHPAATSPTPLSVAELLQYPLASVGITASFGEWLGELTPEQARQATAFVSDDLDLLQLCLPKDHTMKGVRFVFADALDRGLLARVPLQWRSTYHCWMLTTPALWRSPVVKAVADIARETVNASTAR